MKTKCKICRKSFEKPRSNATTCEGCKQPRQCACGCSRLVKNPGSDYAKGHHPATRSTATRKKAGRTLSKVYLARGDALHTKSAEHRAKNSAAHLAKGDLHHTKRPEVRKKISEAVNACYAAGRHGATSKESRAKLSASTIRRFKDPIQRAQQGLIYRNQHLTQTLPERLLHDALDKRKFKYTGLNKKQDRKYGQPVSADLLYPRLKLILQVDGCFWHECPLHGRGRHKHRPIADKRMDSLATKMGWRVLRFWEHDIKTNLPSVVSKIHKLVAVLEGV